MKYIIEIKPEYEDSFKGVMILGTKDSNLFVDTLAVEDLEELNSDYINEHFGDLQDDAYQRGFEDGKQTAVGAAELREELEYQKGFKDGKAQAERGCDGCKYEHSGDMGTPCEHCSKNYKNLWKAKADKIEVGDEVIERDGNKILVSNIHGELFDGLCSDGSTICDLFLEDVVKTGRHFDIASILEDMRHD